MAIKTICNTRFLSPLELAVKNRNLRALMLTVFISTCIIPDKELFTVKYVFYLEKPIYIGT